MALALCSLMGTPEASAQPSTYGGEPLALVDDAGYWSRDSEVFDAQLADFDRRTSIFFEGANGFAIWGYRNPVGTHFQGVTYLESGRFVAIHSFETVDTSKVWILHPDGECAGIVWTEPYDVDEAPETVSAQVECGILRRNHGGAVDSHEDIVVVPDWGFGGSDQIVFLDFASGAPQKLDSLSIPIPNTDEAPAVGLARRQKDGHYYLTVAYVADSGPADVDLYRAQKKDAAGARQSCDLRDVDCRFELVHTLEDVYVSSSGMSLVDMSNGMLALFTMYSPDGMAADFMRVTTLNIDLIEQIPDVPIGHTFTLTDEDDPGENLGVSQVQRKFTRPSCRWACAVNMVNGGLYLVSVSRDVENAGDFELSIYQMDEN